MKSESAIKVLHVLGRMNRGGTEMRTLELMRNLDWKRYRFDFCCLSGLPGELDGEIRSLGGVVHLIPLGILFPSRFRKLLRNGGFHAVHSHVHWFSGYILRLAAKEGVPQRICQFASTWDGKRAHLLRRLRNRILKRWVELHATDIVGVSEGALNANLGPEWSHDARCRVIYRGIDVSQFRIRPDRTGIRAELGIPQDAVVVIHVGRMDPPKNHERLLCIFERFVRMVPGAYLLLIGAVRDPIESSVRRFAARRAISERVVFAGVRADVPRLLRASDLMIFPSLWEGLPGAVLEAVAAELPVLASDLPGINEIARYLPGVRTMSLELPDEEWAAAALNFRSYRDSDIRTAEMFLKSPFSMQYALASSEQLYLCPSVGSRK
jgi:glycosyltransferase involved in cell wall biosynthesis